MTITLALSIALIVALAVLAATAAAVLARVDGATFPIALKAAATVFAATITLACATTAALASVLR
ncbi:hypothetical protein OG322_27655 [Streptomyces sp. NBC_01260]|uniref:Secreted protein n=1 Tax=Streptomyces durocortorensis TaxID=2811104 RepID=A0ABS2I0Q2_9ACTN|nr:MULTISPECIES: hypothetical protein [Streptomyces]MBM7055460.1 hypothetical protein [Streptomyces durocortorensis]